MKELVALCEDLGFTGVASYLQSGNLILDADLDGATVEQRIEEAMRARFDYADIDVLALTGAQLGAVLDGVPVGWKDDETGHLHFTFLKQASAEKPAATSQFLPDDYALGSQVVYVHCPNGYGRTKLTNTFFEKLLRTRATTRNWNTTNKLRELAQG